MGGSSNDDSSQVFANAPKGPLGIDPLQFSVSLFVLLVLYVFYLLLPKAVRKQYFGAYPKRHAWSARSRRRNFATSSVASSSLGTGVNSRTINTLSTGGSTNPPLGLLDPHRGQPHYAPHSNLHPPQPHVSAYDDHSGSAWQDNSQLQHQQPLGRGQSNQPNDEIVVSAAMQQLRDPGVLIVAHGSRGKPKTVRLQLTETAITWRTETRKKTAVPKLGKLHQVPLSHIMYVDVGKQTTALRRVENAQVSEALCFSLLTKEGSLDLEANSPRERDALVSCFSLVLDEVHAQNWRDIYRGPSSDMPSSFDELDQGAGDAKV